jgi:hypothetical protein
MYPYQKSENHTNAGALGADSAESRERVTVTVM